MKSNHRAFVKIMIFKTVFMISLVIGILTLAGRLTI
jgi:hypothetical protein